MKNLFLLLIFCFSILPGFSQNHLKSYYNTKSQVYGGMEDGGISGTESYYFKVYQTIELSEIKENGKPLQLQKGDTLIVNVHFFKAYNTHPALLDSTLKSNQNPSIELPEKFTIFKSGKRIYLNTDENLSWNKCLAYTYKSKPYTSCAKEGFDSNSTGYAP